MIDWVENISVDTISRLTLLLHVAFIYFFIKELLQTTFKNRHEKIYWKVLASLFGIWGYSHYLAFRRKPIVKRKFNPDLRDKLQEA